MSPSAMAVPSSSVTAASPRATAQSWCRLRDHCLQGFVEPAEFLKLARQLDAACRISGMAVADILFRPGPIGSKFEPSMRRIRYVWSLCATGRLSLLNVVTAVLRYSTIHRLASAHLTASPPAGPKPVLRFVDSLLCDDMILVDLRDMARKETAIVFGDYSIALLKLMSEWMTLMTTALGNRDAILANDVRKDKHVMEKLRKLSAAVAELVATVLDHDSVQKTLTKKPAAEARKVLSEALAAFVPAITGYPASAQPAARLKQFHEQTLPSLAPADSALQTQLDKGLESMEATTWLERTEIPPVPIATSRAGLYLYLNAALVGLPILDDGALYTRLRNRYTTNVQAAFVALILASFDVLGNAVSRGEGQEGAFVFRSFLVNKVPALLSSLAPSLYAVGASPEMCISQAIAQIDAHAFPTMSSMFDDSRQSNPFTDGVRDDFLFACCLFGLIPHASIAVILGESTYQMLPSAGKHSVEGLVAECLADPDRAPRLVSELDLMDGNVGPVCLALARIMADMCANKDTAPLKAICHQLLNRPMRFDVMLLFVAPSALLTPIFELLETGFQYEEELAEYQPVYEEFGAIILLALALMHRYGLTARDLGLGAQNQSYAARLLVSGQAGRPLKELEDEEREHLILWIRDLFDADAGGISEDLISSCSPPSFYRLVTAIFRQIILGVAYGNITDDSLKSGIEYLAETFLRPSLVLAVWYLVEQLRNDVEPEQRAIIKIFHYMLLPRPASSESAMFLNTVLSICIPQMEPVLRAYQRRRHQSGSSSGNDVQLVLQTIKDGKPASFRRTGLVDAKEAAAWVGSFDGGLTGMLRHIFRALSNWATGPGITPTPYTHRQITLAVQTLGAVRAVRILLSEIRAHADAATIGYAYDVATEIICAADMTAGGLPGSLPGPRRPASLRQALWWEALDARATSQTDPPMAEATVRLHRHVEAQLAPAAKQPAPALLDHDVAALAMGMDVDVGGVADGDLASAMAAATAGGAVGGEGTSDFDLDMGTAVGGQGLDLGVSSATDAPDTDMFAGLTSLNDWGNMDS